MQISPKHLSLFQSLGADEGFIEWARRSPRTYEAMATSHPSWAEWVASCRKISGDVLNSLTNSPDPDVRIALAFNPNTPQHALGEMKYDSCEWVRVGVASHKNTSLEILATMACDRCDLVRVAVAKNEHTPLDAVVVLETDSCDEVRDAALRHSPQAA
jgi:hypothetical protein